MHLKHRLWKRNPPETMVKLAAANNMYVSFTYQREILRRHRQLFHSGDISLAPFLLMSQLIFRYRSISNFWIEGRCLTVAAATLAWRSLKTKGMFKQEVVLFGRKQLFGAEKK